MTLPFSSLLFLSLFILSVIPTQNKYSFKRREAQPQESRSVEGRSEEVTLT
jgi:hypothetical protein